MRNLLYIPTVHDFGEVNPLVLQLASLAGSRRLNAELIQNALWESVDEALTQFREDYSGVKVFAEGNTRTVPAVDEADRASFSAASALTKEIQSLFSYKQRQGYLANSLYMAGATIIATEDSTLHQEGSRLASLLLKERNFFEGAKLRVEFEQNTKQRNEQFARIVNQNLTEGDHGILIAGLGHNILPLLSGNIVIDFINPLAKELWGIQQEGIDFLSEAVVHRVENIQRVSNKERL